MIEYLEKLNIELPPSDWDDFLSRKSVHDKRVKRRRWFISSAISISSAAVLMLLFLFLLPFERHQSEQMDHEQRSQGSMYYGNRPSDITGASLPSDYKKVLPSEDVISTLEEPISSICLISAQELKHIDLGLSVEWAECNLGATKCWETGNYYAWGETTISDSYDYDDYSWYNGSDSTFITGYFFPLFSKYCSDGPNFNTRNGFIDGKRVLEKEDDAATSILGGKWRMPTIDEYQELFDNCEWKWATENQHNGYWVISKINGNSIFLPVTGFFVMTRIEGNGNGYYWTSNLSSNNISADCLFFDEEEYFILGRGRFYGNIIRPIWDPLNER